MSSSARPSSNSATATTPRRRNWPYWQQIKPHPLSPLERRGGETGPADEQELADEIRRIYRGDVVAARDLDVF